MQTRPNGGLAFLAYVILSISVSLMASILYQDMSKEKLEKTEIDDYK